MTDSQRGPRIEQKLTRAARKPMRHQDCGGPLRWLSAGRYHCGTCGELLSFGYSSTAHLKPSSGSRIVQGKKVDLD